MSKSATANFLLSVKSENTKSAKLAFERLLNEGTDINKMKFGKYTPLTLAVAKNNIDLVLYFLENGADPNQRDDEATPLYRACTKNYLEVARLLIKKGADPNQEGAVIVNKATPLNIAVVKGSKELVELLVNAGANINENTFELPLYTCIYLNKVDIFDLLLQKGANPNLPGSTNLSHPVEPYPPLILAITQKPPHDFQYIQKLVTAGADVNIVYRGYSALLFACSLSTPDVVRYLCENGADVNYSVPSRGFTSLMMAIRREVVSLDVLRILCEFGADANATDMNGLTPFLYAQALGNEVMMYAILDILYTCAVSDPKKFNTSVPSSINRITTNEPQALEIEKEEIKMGIVQAILYGDIRKVDEYLALGFDLKRDDSPILSAIILGNTTILNHLLSKIEVIVPYLEQLILIASQHGKLNTFKYLMDRLHRLLPDTNEPKNYPNVIYDLFARNNREKILTILRSALYRAIERKNNLIVDYIFHLYPELQEPTFLEKLLEHSMRVRNDDIAEYIIDTGLPSQEALKKAVLHYTVLANIPFLMFLNSKGIDFKAMEKEIIEQLRYIRSSSDRSNVLFYLISLGLAQNVSYNNVSGNNNIYAGGKRKTRRQPRRHRKSNSRSQKY